MGSLMLLEEYTKLDITEQQKWIIKCEIVVTLVFKENLSLWFHCWQTNNQLDKGKSPNRTESKLELRYYEVSSKPAYIFPDCLHIKNLLLSIPLSQYYLSKHLLLTFMAL